MEVLAVCMEDPEFILGGMGRHVRELYKEMSLNKDIEIDLLTMGPGDSRDYLGYTKLLASKIVNYKPKYPGMSAILISEIQMLKTAMKLIADGKRWDIVHVHEWNSFQVAKIISEALHIPLVGTMHLCITKLSMIEALKGSEKEIYPPPEDNIYLMQMEGHLVTQVDELILCSNAYKKMAKEVFLTDREINVIYNGIDINEWYPEAGNRDRAIKKFNLPDKPIALYVGRIADMKGIRPILDLASTIKLDYLIVLVGEVNANSEEDKENWEVTKRIRDLEKRFPERIKWLGFQQDSDLKDLYSSATIGLMPSIHEPFGIVALEFMAMGIPLITTEVDGLKEIVSDKDGNEYSLIIRPNSIYDLEEAMATLKDETSRKELKELGLKRAKDFNWNRITEETIGVYKKAIYGREICHIF
jgi:glycosyltransferase involved in cell wall biosynthesis